ncbi:hypothetical protein [Marasmitruncus massiliensis]|uniref:hypothetical protein n=1 Tax=Marasmitruncus massiliensis TaxID=1944642 RepID=UPI000C7B7FB2|nr:hypothetical protein [Marasmitruncus massiliensis]
MKTVPEQLLTPYGVFSGISTAEYDQNGAIRNIRLTEKNVLISHAGELVPSYTADNPRKKFKPSVSFHPNGMVKSVSLEEQQEVMTPIGEFPAELVTFYSSGELRRIFPLDGKISGFWPEEEERALNIPFHFSLGFADFSALLTGICFYKSGAIRSITLFPKEEIDVIIPDGGCVHTRKGFSMHEDGALQSLEPAVPTPVKTPVGILTAYDETCDGICADDCSLHYDEQGRIESVVTSSDRVAVITKESSTRYFAPAIRPSLVDETAVMRVPIRFFFDYAENAARIMDADSKEHYFSLSESTFHVYPNAIGGCTPQQCANCHLCQ